MKAVWNSQIVAESDDTVIVEGNHYFPRAALREDALAPSDTDGLPLEGGGDLPLEGSWARFCCATAHYYHLVIDGETNTDAVWYYPAPKAAARQIDGRVAFWHGVEVMA